MIIREQLIKCREETLTLTNQRAVFWKTASILFLSDLHIGKSAHFRKHGIPVSSQVLETDLNRLELLINYFNPATILVVGDMFHAESNGDISRFNIWKQAHNQIEFILVRGNHDRWSFDVYDQLNIKVMQRSFVHRPFLFVHDIKKPTQSDFYISGHTHPGIRIQGRGKQTIKLPCYQLTDSQLILPAFSLFTGLNTKNAPENCTYYAITDTDIFVI